MKSEKSKKKPKTNPKENSSTAQEQPQSVEIVNEGNFIRLTSADENSPDAKPVDGDLKRRKLSLKRFLIPILRRASYRWKPRGEALKKSRLERGLYQCNSCKELFKQTDICLDHIFPVVNPKIGFTNWDDYIDRMFPETEGFQVLCKLCHDVKTKLEDEMRKIYTNKGKEK